MYIPDGFLDPKVWLGASAISARALGRNSNPSQKGFERAAGKSPPSMKQTKGDIDFLVSARAPR